MDITRPLSEIIHYPLSIRKVPSPIMTVKHCWRLASALQVREQEESKQFQKISDLQKNSVKQTTTKIVVLPPPISPASLQKPREVDGLKPKLLDRKNSECTEKNVTVLTKSRKKSRFVYSVLSTISNYDFDFQCNFRTTFSQIDILTQLTKTTVIWIQKARTYCCSSHRSKAQQV
jgi:hypothetical protein